MFMYFKLCLAILFVLSAFPYVYVMQRNHRRFYTHYSKIGSVIFIGLVFLFCMLICCSVFRILPQKVIDLLGILWWIVYLINYIFIDSYFTDNERM